MQLVQKSLILLLLSFTASVCYSQENKPILLTDSTFVMDEEVSGELFQEVSDLDPQRAALLSAVFPGLGQIYNRQYWKVPIVITGMVVFAHYINYNNKVYHALRNAAIISNAGLETPYNGIINSTDGLVRNREIFRRNRDFMIVLGTAFYLLQVVDAHVSAHLDEFVVNKDLAFKIKPSIESTPLFSHAVGVSFALRF